MAHSLSDDHVGLTIQQASDGVTGPQRPLQEAAEAHGPRQRPAAPGGLPSCHWAEWAASDTHAGPGSHAASGERMGAPGAEGRGRSRTSPSASHPHPLASLTGQVNWFLTPQCNYRCKFCFATFQDWDHAEAERDENRLMKARRGAWGSPKVRLRETG
jgi:hypothetical protein